MKNAIRKLKIMTILGTRPEAIKMASVILELNKYPELFQVSVCVTAQHRQMLDQVLEIFAIKPDYDLNIMKKDQDLFDITANCLFGLRDILKQANPDIVLVQGDTTTALVAALSAYYLKISVAHVEAGLRTHNKYSPFPEEENRHLISVLAELHFAPTELSKRNLINEGVSEDKIFVTGNTVIDALMNIVEKNNNPDLRQSFEKMFDYLNNSKKLILITGHRRESFGEGFKNICMAVRELAAEYSDYEFVYPMHLNPNVRKPVREILGNGKLLSIHLIEPLDYLPFVYLMNRSYLIITDSGGIQEEAPSLGKPVLVMRDTTERPEGIEAGVVKLIGNNKTSIINEVKQILSNKDEYNKMSQTKNPYGDGHASERICKILSNYLTERQHN